jgi:glyoxylase-like metal-dependent hydrolase (beta-lactamase superfamily II)
MGIEGIIGGGYFGGFPTKYYVAGFCENDANVAMKGEKRAKMRFPATAVLLIHPDGRKILFDTGYATRFHEETKRWPFSLYSRVTPVTITEQTELKAQLMDDGVKPGDIDIVILSHFHADHLAGLKDFPNAKIISTAAGADQALTLKGFSAVRKGIVPAFLPADFKERFKAVEAMKSVSVADRLHVFTTAWDVLGDGSILAVPLPGHARGQFGILFSDENHGETFLIADATWSSKAYRERRKPSWTAGFAFDSRQEYAGTFQRICELHSLCPWVKIVPTHCAETWQLAKADASKKIASTFLGKPMDLDKRDRSFTPGYPHPTKALTWPGQDINGEYWSKGGLRTYTIRPNPDGSFWLTVVGKSFDTVEQAKHAATADHIGFVRNQIAELQEWVGYSDVLYERSRENHGG